MLGILNIPPPIKGLEGGCDEYPSCINDVVANNQRFTKRYDHVDTEYIKNSP